ncbi:FKBP-type peptidyl-prolyl cis-trans isomerase [Sphingomonas sp. AP4-R1]|uniref:FKBP-type peptidyl-prolyl cis-trans isomerase n=1 Tax=Sphingomonas sp. AP4-R1 TaxID=2735134 RepID=UPI001493A92F|nr:FKBP-type peptidyl-prolyl cis-trans isomerase [Sphingomonas sp. AP4-R1]QJU56662.1 FKBP-type peptidyl-prolyl cis-trans isomerase [Sphingomonas sp. AP4-R1]
MSEVTAVPLRPVNKAGLAALFTSIGVLIVVGIGSAYATTKAPVMLAMPPAEFLAANAKRSGVKTTASGLEYQVLTAGDGPTPTLADAALVEYKGSLTSGQVFDASKPGQPVPMQIGQVVPGFAEALTLMPKGAKYRVWIPPQLGYGEREAGPIPANSVLVFDITMHEFAAVPQPNAEMMSAPHADGTPGTPPPTTIQ